MYRGVHITMAETQLKISQSEWPAVALQITNQLLCSSPQCNAVCRRYSHPDALLCTVNRALVG